MSALAMVLMSAPGLGYELVDRLVAQLGGESDGVWDAHSVAASAARLGQARARAKGRVLVEALVLTLGLVSALAKVGVTAAALALESAPELALAMGREWGLGLAAQWAPASARALAQM